MPRNSRALVALGLLVMDMNLEDMFLRSGKQQGVGIAESKGQADTMVRTDRWGLLGAMVGWQEACKSQDTMYKFKIVQRKRDS